MDVHKIKSHVLFPGLLLVLRTNPFYTRASFHERNISLFIQSWPPLNLADMETRDGTPFMGLTTQDGIPSSVENLKPNKQTTTNKTRCTSCPQSEECTCKATFFVQRCKDCLHFAASPERHREHRREARHIHSYRNRAYRFVNLCHEVFHLYFCIHIYVITIYYSMRHWDKSDT